MEAQGGARWFGSLQSGSRDASGQFYRRNRYYDPNSGHFTQGDPIGLAGGLNTYGFAEGDPVSYSDPYGLKVCYRGNARQIDRLRAATADAVGASVGLNSDHCISSIGETRNPGLRGLRNRLALLSSVEASYTVSFDLSGLGLDDPGDELTGHGAVRQSHTLVHCNANDCPSSEVLIGSGWARAPYPSPSFFGGCRGRTAPTLGNLIAHELIGHGFEAYAYGSAGRTLSEMFTIRHADRLYQSVRTMPLRCAH